MDEYECYDVTCPKVDAVIGYLRRCRLEWAERAPLCTFEVRDGSALDQEFAHPSLTGLAVCVAIPTEERRALQGHSQEGPRMCEVIWCFVSVHIEG